MKAPSFFIAEESHDGVLMEYRSKRRGFQFYVQGQIKELSKNFATEIKKLEIEVKKQEVCQKILLYIYYTCIFFLKVVFDTVVTYFEMKFENGGYKKMLDHQTARKDSFMPIKASVVFEMFPFCILYNVILFYHLIFPPPPSPTSG